MRTKFDEQLNTLHKKLFQMGQLCEQAIMYSTQSLENADEEILKKVFALRSEIDQSEREIETMCMRLLLQQQPVAKDLRTISAAMKMIYDMERIGDQAADIAELASYLTESDILTRIHIGPMVEATCRMVTDSVIAFVRPDLNLALQVIQDDDKVDELFSKVKEELMELIYRKDIDAKVSLDTLMAAKYLERIADHAVNIAKWVEFSITGENSQISE